jgi:hypothetical protein
VKKETKNQHAVFLGTSRKVRGEIEFKQPKKTDDTISIKFKNTKLYTRNNQPLTDYTIDKFSNRVKGDSLKLKIPLSKKTPPGTHSVDILVNDEKIPAVFEVQERVYANIKPSKLYIEALPGSTVSRSIYVSNKGNVPLVFKNPGAIILETEFLECRVIRKVVRTVDKEKATLDKLIGLSAVALEELYNEGGLLKVRLKEEAIEIKPDTTEKIELNITIPASLKHPNRYSGTYRFYNTALHFSVTPTLKEKSKP